MCGDVYRPQLRHWRRHEATSRLFERGYQINEVAQFTLHESWNELKRYTQRKAFGWRAPTRFVTAYREIAIVRCDVFLNDRESVAGFELSAKILKCALNVLLEQLLDLTLIAFEPGIEQSAMLQVSASVAAGRLQMRDNVPLGENGQQFDQLCGHQLVSGPHQRNMELTVTHRDVRQVSIGGSFECSESVHCLRAIVIGRDLRCICCCLWFDGQAQREYLICLLARHREYEIAAIGLIDQQARLFQPGQGFAQWNLADSQLTRQRILPNRFAGGQLPFENPLAD